MSLTRIQDDLCTVSDRDRRNESIYDYKLSNIPDYRRGYQLSNQQYIQNQRSLEMDIDLESQLQGLERVNNECNMYGAGVQQRILDNAPKMQAICMGNSLAPTYSRQTKVWRHTDTFQSQRAKPMDWHFFSQPVNVFNFGQFQYNRWTDTRALSMDQSTLENRLMLLRRGSKQF